MIEFLFGLDLAILHFFNVTLANPIMDQFWLGITQLHKQLWFQVGVVPVLLALLFYIYRLRAVKVLLVAALAVGLADSLAYRGIKSEVKRQRPFQNTEISWVRKAGEAHGTSFPSNHAANVFAAAVVMAWYFPALGYVFYILAALVAISRMSLGVHYPSDVLGGAMLGIIVGYLIRIWLLNRFSVLALRAGVSSRDGISSLERIRSRRV